MSGTGFEPRCISGLQRAQLGDGIAPTLRAAAAVGRLANADRASRLRHLMTRPIAGLTLGAAQRRLAVGFAASWYDCIPLRNRIQGVQPLT
jgi:hypothetical protein